MRELSEGVWVYGRYGSGPILFYVKRVIGETVVLGNPRWLASAVVALEVERVKKWAVIGKGVRKWYWRFLPWRSLICPFTKPAEADWL